MIVDLRSDTVTRPTPEMLSAMVSAPVGDDVLGDDPTVQELEALAATMLGKESALFVCSGTMGNQIAINVHTQPGDAVIAEEESHIMVYEVGGPGALSGVVTWTLPSHFGAMDPEAVRKRVYQADLHHPGTTLICVENTHNRHGGAIVPLETLEAYRAIADASGAKLHCDGARVFNAAVASNRPISEIAAPFDSITFCLSKGLRSPVGSILCGSNEFIDKARRVRKRFGGGLRQSGLLAACGLVSLRTMVDRLNEDHARAKRLASAVSQLPGFSVDLARVETNIVLVNTDEPAAGWQDRLDEVGVRCFSVDDHRLRFVLHGDVSEDQVDFAIDRITQLSRQGKA